MPESAPAAGFALTPRAIPWVEFGDIFIIVDPDGVVVLSGNSARLNQIPRLQSPSLIPVFSVVAGLRIFLKIEFTTDGVVTFERVNFQEPEPPGGPTVDWYIGNVPVVEYVPSGFVPVLVGVVVNSWSNSIPRFSV